MPRFVKELIYMLGDWSSTSRSNTRHVSRIVHTKIQISFKTRQTTEIISDNASQLKRASETLDKPWGQILTHDDVTFYIVNEGITWKYIVEFAPWMGGFYERLVGLVKRTLRKAIGRSSLANEQLLTVLKNRKLSLTLDHSSMLEMISNHTSL